jgi:hypothetical protein
VQKHRQLLNHQNTNQIQLQRTPLQPIKSNTAIAILHLNIRRSIHLHQNPYNPSRTHHPVHLLPPHSSPITKRLSTKNPHIKLILKFITSILLSSTRNCNQPLNSLEIVNMSISSLVVLMSSVSHVLDSLDYLMDLLMKLGDLLVKHLVNTLLLLL